MKDGQILEFIRQRMIDRHGEHESCDYMLHLKRMVSDQSCRDLEIAEKPCGLTLDLALIRWSVMCESWGELSSGSAPQLGSFLAGWFTRAMGATKPEKLGQLRDSYMVGWREADSCVNIKRREENEN